jgi:hypothetical protein
LYIVFSKPTRPPAQPNRNLWSSSAGFLFASNFLTWGLNWHWRVSVCALVAKNQQLWRARKAEEAHLLR